MFRRDVLRRVPFAPFAIGAVATQAPGVVQQIDETPLDMAEVELPERIEWARDAVADLVQPAGRMPFPGDVMTIKSLQTIVRWTQYEDTLAKIAQTYELPLQDVRHLAGLG